MLRFFKINKPKIKIEKIHSFKIDLSIDNEENLEEFVKECKHDRFTEKVRFDLLTLLTNPDNYLTLPDLNNQIVKLYGLKTNKILFYIPTFFVREIIDTQMIFKMSLQDLKKVLSINYEKDISLIASDPIKSPFRTAYLVLTTVDQLTNLADLYKNTEKNMKTNQIHECNITAEIKIQGPNIYNINNNLILTIPTVRCTNAKVTIKARKETTFHKFEQHRDTYFIYNYHSRF
jgi:hypothetical protein